MQNKNAKLLLIGSLVVSLIAWAGWILVDGIENDKGWKPTESQLAEVTPEVQREYQEIVIGEERLRVEVADTIQKITTGLSYRSELGSGGMLFVMPSRSVPSFWMRGMRFPLDMVWIDCGAGSREQGTMSSEGVGGNGDCEVVDVTENVPVEVDPEHPVNYYSPKVPVTHVLEVPAGWVGKSGIKRGEVVNLGS